MTGEGGLCSLSHTRGQDLFNVQGGVWPGLWHAGGVLRAGDGPGGTSPLSRLPAQVVCSVGRGDRPLRHQSSLPRTLEAALAQCGLAEASQVAIVRQRVKAAAEAALAAVLTLEAGLSAEQRGGRQVRTDFLGECGASGD